LSFVVLGLRDDLYEEVIYIDKDKIQSQVLPQLFQTPQNIFAV